MTNLLRETVEAIEHRGQVVDSIVFVGSLVSGHSCSWSEFETLADFDYDAGFGAAQVPQDLCIAFADGAQMFRGEYDGSEWWEYVPPFQLPSKRLPISTLRCPEKRVGWISLAEANETAEAQS